MQVKFELVNYDEENDTFTLDENIYSLELTNEQEETYDLLKSTDLHLYNWFKESDFFINWIKNEVYPNSIGKKFAINSIDDIGFYRFYFFKVTSSDSHYDYFKKLFDIHEESHWQDREDVGEEILKALSFKKQELVIELKKDYILLCNIQS